MCVGVNQAVCVCVCVFDDEVYGFLFKKIYIYIYIYFDMLDIRICIACVNDIYISDN
jgi:hypothetical protein